MSSPSNQLSQRVKDGLAQRLAEYPAVLRTRSIGDVAPTKMRRIELLDLNREADRCRWQLLHNNPDKFEVISEKESHQKQEYFVRIIYNELGDELAAVKTKEELRSEDNGSV